MSRWRLTLSIVKREALVPDIVQEVFLLIYRHLPKFQFKSAFKTWIYRITVNEAMRQLTKSKRWQPIPDGEPDAINALSTLVVYENGVTPEREMITGEQKELVHKALDTLKSNHRIILTLYYLEDMSVQEIADVLDIPDGSVKSRLYYARESLRKALEPIVSRVPEGMGGLHVL
jgi:RNA polymerase sigma-70 factor (ECF subfamily)